MGRAWHGMTGPMGRIETRSASRKQREGVSDVCEGRVVTVDRYERRCLGRRPGIAEGGIAGLHIIIAIAFGSSVP